MKKRLLSALLALALVFVLLPTTALAKVVKRDEDISIAGIDWKFESDSEVGYFYNGNFTTTEPSGSYLKLTKNSNTITITVYGNVTVSDIKVHNNFSTQDKINLIITGNKRSTLTLNCTGISGAALETFQSGDITIKGGVTVNANFSAINTKNFTDCYGISASKNLIITDSGTIVNAVNADHDAAAVKVDGNITVSGGAQLNATNKYYGNNNKDKAYAIECGGQLSISGDKTQVTAYTSNGEKAISGTVNNGDKLTFKAAASKDNPFFSQKPMDKALGYAYVEITQAPTTSDVRIAGEPAIIGQETPIPGGTGTYLYKKTTYDGSFLTLKGVDITGTSTGPARFIQFGKNGYYTIELEGENKISGFSSGIVAPKDPGVDDVTVVLSGSGSLDISAKQYAIDMQVGKLKFENTGKIKLTTGYVFTYPLNALHVAGSISIDNAKYDIVGARQENNYPTETISDSSAFTPDLLKGYTVGGETTLFKTITITPAAAKPSTISYDGKTLKQGQTITDENGGKATVAPKGNTITLNNFNGTALSFDATLADSTLVLEGTNTLSSIVTTQKGLTISGSGSLTAGSIKVTNDTRYTGNLTITDGAKVTAGTASNTDRAIDIKGDLTVTNGSLTATSKSDSVPTVQVGGNATFTGSTVTITNNSTALHKDAADATKGDSVSSALYVKGNINITDNANVTAKVENGGGNAIGALGNITVNGSNVTAVNKGQKFTTIIAKNVYVSGDSKITANNLNKNSLYNGLYLACPAIEGNIVNKNTDYSLNFKGEHSSSSEPKTTLAPGEQTTLYYYNVTITRGDKVTRTESPVVIAGTTLLNDTYYTINGSTVAKGSKNDYNAFYDSETKTLKLNNASINGAGTNKAIEANVGGYTFTIELVGNNIIKTSGFANNVIDITGNLYFTGSGTAEVSGKGTPIYATYKIDVSADVTITNTEKAGSFTFSAYGENSSNYKGANTFAIGAGYTAYATTDKTTWAVYDNTTASENESYTTLRVTKENLAPTTPTPQKPFTIDGIPAQFVDGGMIATTGVTATSSNNINLPIDRVKWYTFTPVFGSDGRMDSVSDKTEATGNFEAGKYYVVEIKFVQDLSPFKSWDMKVSGWSDNDVYRQSETARNDIEIYFLTPASAATHEHNWVEKYDTVYHWKMCTYDGCTAIKDKAPHEWVGWKIDEPRQGMHNRFCNCGYNDYSHHYNLVYAAAGEAGHYQYCTLGNCTFKTSTVPHNYDGDTCTICNYTKSGEIVPPTPDNPGTIVIIRPAEEEKPAQQPNPSTGANDLVGMAVAAAVAAALGSAALLRKHD